jgi:HTH-type transcriptional regulator/antitoxin HigA
MPATARKPISRKPRVKRREPTESYWKLCRRFPLRPITSETELDLATAIIDELVDRGFDKLDSGEADYLDVLSELSEAYEEQQHPLDPVSDGEMLEFLCDQHQVTRNKVAEATGISATTLSAVAQGKKEFTRDQIRRLCEFFHTTPEVFTT